MFAESQILTSKEPRSFMQPFSLSPTWDGDVPVGVPGDSLAISLGAVTGSGGRRWLPAELQGSKDVNESH